MAGFEDVIQRALENNQPASPEVRAQVYRSARTALDDMLKKAGNLNPENIRDQQQKLEMAIADIEAEHIVFENLHQPENETAHLEAENVGYDETATEISVGRRRPFAKMLLVTTILVAFGIFGWWAYDQELTKPAATRDNSVPNPPKILVEEESREKVSNSRQADWITIFEPGDPRSLITEGAVTANLEKDDIGAYIRLKIPKGDKNSSVKLLVEPGVMESIQGKTVTVELKIKSGDDDQQQFVVTCQFRELGDCGRKRFTVGKSVELFVFKTKLKDTSLSEDEKSGFISINTDITRSGRPMDLYLVRVNTE